MSDKIPGIWNTDLQTYHADFSAIGHSMIDDAIENLRYYEGRYVVNTIPADEPTPAMLFGIVGHVFILEPVEAFESRFFIPPPLAPDGTPWDRRKTEHKKAWEPIKADTRQQITQEDYNLCNAMYEALSLDEQANEYLFLDDGPSEQAIRWIDPETGLTLKACRDKVADNNSIIINLKTCQSANPSRCIKDAFNYGYHRAAAHYLDGHKAVFGEEAKGHLFICVSKESLPRVCCYELDQAAIELGRKQNRAALQKIGEAMATGDWSNPEEGKVLRLALPNYAFYSDYEVSNG